MNDVRLEQFESFVHIFYNTFPNKALNVLNSSKSIEIAKHNWAQISAQCDVGSIANWALLKWLPDLGRGGATKSDEFLEKFQMAFAFGPPPHFRKIMLQIFYNG